MKYSLTQIFNSPAKRQLEMILVSENDLTAKEFVQLLNSEHVSEVCKSHILGMIEQMIELTKDGVLNYSEFIDEFNKQLTKSKGDIETDEFRQD